MAEADFTVSFSGTQNRILTSASKSLDPPWRLVVGGDAVLGSEAGPIWAMQTYTHDPATSHSSKR